MARRKEAPKREVTPDPKFGSESLAKFINVLMRSGKKSTAEKIVYGALTLIAERSKTDPLEVYKTAIENVRPLVEVKSRRVGGATYQVADRSTSGAPGRPRHALGHRSSACARREIHGCAAGRRTHGSRRTARHCHEEARRRASHGRGQ